jgi:pseudaminic acid biosynthesis-associated methylase
MTMSEAERLEQLWGGAFGDDYVDRNLQAYATRGEFWSPLMAELVPASVLEVGCNVGGNLQWIAQAIGADKCHGIDINEKVLAALTERIPELDARFGSARELPWADRSIEFVFTQGVLIHQPEESLPVVMDEMVRVASRWVLCGEYYDDDTTEVNYRGNEGALFRRDYGGIFAERYPNDLTLVRQGFLGKDDGWDDVTWWLFQKN